MPFRESELDCVLVLIASDIMSTITSSSLLTGKGGFSGKGLCHCPIPSCTTAKGKVKGRLRHLPKKYSTMAKDSKEAVASELRKSKLMRQPDFRQAKLRSIREKNYC